MRWVLHPDFARGAERVLPWLDADPVGNSLQAGVVRGVLAGLYAVDASAVLAHAEHGAATVGVAVRTPGRRLLLSAMPVSAAATLPENLAPAGLVLPGVAGPVACTDAFAAVWANDTGCGVRLSMAQRVHRLDRVLPPRGVPGRLRDSRAGELALILQRARAMGEEIGADHAEHDPELPAVLRRRIAEGRMPVWEVEDEIVYAAACVAAVSQRALDGGAIACSLLTDQANPTSNGVYRRIGYYPVADVQELTFTS